MPSGKKNLKSLFLIGGERGWPDEAASRQSAGSDHGHLPLTRQDQRRAHRLPHGHQAIRVHRVGEFQSELCTVKMFQWIFEKVEQERNIIPKTKRDIYVFGKCHGNRFHSILLMFGSLPGYHLSVCVRKNATPLWAGTGGGIVGRSFNWKTHIRIQ